MLARGTCIGALAIALTTIGCGGGGGNHGCPPGHGIVLLSWTVRGQPAGADSCKAIDHLLLQLQTSCGTVEIEPIPCIQGAHWEYDNLPEGDAGAVLQALDARAAVTLIGSAVTHLSVVKPSAPTPIDLQ